MVAHRRGGAGETVVLQALDGVLGDLLRRARRVTHPLVRRHALGGVADLVVALASGPRAEHVTDAERGDELELH
ncbi:MAG: hypothetical protein PGN07_12470 [Aeromicrobium erythreum]